MAERSSTKTSMRKVAVASLVGNALEWYLTLINLLIL